MIFWRCAFLLLAEINLKIFRRGFLVGGSIFMFKVDFSKIMVMIFFLLFRFQESFNEIGLYFQKINTLRSRSGLLFTKIFFRFFQPHFYFAAEHIFIFKWHAFKTPSLFTKDQDQITTPHSPLLLIKSGCGCGCGCGS